MGLLSEDIAQAMKRQQDEKEAAVQEKSLVNKSKPYIDNRAPVIPTGNAKEHGVATVQCTDQYSLFKTVNSNRKINQSHVNTLMGAIRKKNMLHLNPIVVNGNMEVIDGQHRLAAAKKLNLPVCYMIDKTISHSDISSLNSNKKNWQMMDYVNFFAKEGRNDFKQFLDLCNNYTELKPSWVQALCSKTGVRKGFNIKHGEIDIANIDSAYMWAGYLRDFSKYIPTVYSSRFIEGSVGFFSAMIYDHEKMMCNLADNQDMIQPYVDAKDYTKMLTKIFKKQ